MKNRFAMAALTSAVMFLALGAQSAEFEEVKKKRSELMKGLSSENKAMRNAAQEGNMADVEKSARELASQFAMIPDRSLFPEGSSGEDTRAKPAIWENWTEFEEKARSPWRWRPKPKPATWRKSKRSRVHWARRRAATVTRPFGLRRKSLISKGDIPGSTPGMSPSSEAPTTTTHRWLQPLPLFVWKWPQPDRR